MPRTRLAPSPTGALHLGNARTFLVNWALARQQGWSIVLRIEDLDGPRVKPEAAAEAIDVLVWLGIDWDEGPYYQRADLAPYGAALAQLGAQGDLYPCRCTRREIEAAALSAPHGDEHELRYPGTCRPDRRPSVYERGGLHGEKSGSAFEIESGSELPSDLIPPLFAAQATTALRSGDLGSPVLGCSHPFQGGGCRAAWRICIPDGATSFVDQFAGRHEHDIQATSGDFLVATKEGLPSYQLAVVVDDARQGIDRVVRGDDLLASAHRQRLLYERLHLGPPPEYFHLPLVVGEDGRRLAKRHGDSRVSYIRAAGVQAESIVGLAAEWCGMGSRRSMTAAQFLEEFDPSRLPHEQIVFHAADMAWLLQST